MSYFDEARHFEGGGGTANDKLDGTYIPDEWGRPGTTYDGILTILFLLYWGYNTTTITMVRTTSCQFEFPMESATKIFTLVGTT